MDERRTLIVVTAVLFFLVVLFGVSAYFSRKQDEDSFTPKRFTAKEGTTRDGARILTSTQRPASKTPPADTAPSGKKLPSASLSPKPDPESGAATRAAKVREAVEASAGDEGALRALLSAADGEEQRLELLGEIASAQQGVAPEISLKLAAVVQAVLGKDFGEELRQLVRAKQGQQLLHDAQWQPASDLVATQDDDSQEPSNGNVSLLVVRGQAMEGLGKKEEALGAYEAAFVQAEQLNMILPDAKEALRLAALRQTRLAREEGRDAGNLWSDRLRKILEKTGDSATPAGAAE